MPTAHYHYGVVIKNFYTINVFTSVSNRRISMLRKGSRTKQKNWREYQDGFHTRKIILSKFYPDEGSFVQDASTLVQVIGYTFLVQDLNTWFKLLILFNYPKALSCRLCFACADKRYRGCSRRDEKGRMSGWKLAMYWENYLSLRTTFLTLVLRHHSLLKR